MYLDLLKEELVKKLEIFNERILTAARLIAPRIDEKEDWEKGQLVIYLLYIDNVYIISNYY